MTTENEPVYYSRFQRRVLWHLTQGLTVKQTAEAMGVNRTSVIDSLLIIRRKADARTTTQAVLKAYLDGAVGPRADCGTRAAYVRHLDADEDACPACRRANLVWLKSHSEDAPAPRPLTSAQVRIIRAFHCGRSHADLQQQWGVSRGRLYRAVTDMYARLGVTEIPREERRERALEVAQEQGYLTAEAPVRLPPVQGRPQALTAREKETLAAVQGGVPLSRAAAVLGITAPSLASRLTEIYRKLGVSHLPRRSKRAAALRVAAHKGYLG